MASLPQIEANRRNSQLSTGPRTAAGKATSSRNATRSGIYAESVLLIGEDPAEFAALAREYEDSCRPVGPRERAVVDTLIHTDWLLRRVRLLETQDWNSELEQIYEGAEILTYALLNAHDEIAERLERIQRRLTALDRIYHRALADLHRLQSNRPPEISSAPVPGPEIGFVPSLVAPDRPTSTARSAGPAPDCPVPEIGFVPSQTRPTAAAPAATVTP
jgi:hypothetical protein